MVDKVARYTLKNIDAGYKEYPFILSGSDERKYNAPGVDLPVISVMRSKYGEYPEYHTSKDDMSIISPEGLGGGFEAVKQMIEVLEANEKYRVTTLCEPQLGRRGLYPTTSTHDTWRQVKALKNLLAYCDGTEDLIWVCEKICEKIVDVLPIVERLVAEGLLEVCN
jgi:aminopeptidase-like protein